MKFNHVSTFSWEGHIEINKNEEESCFSLVEVIWEKRENHFHFLKEVRKQEI